MFDLGFSELLMIGVVALIVLGPERLPKAARLAGLWVRRARAQWHSVKNELERDLAAEELRRSLQDTQQGVRDIDTALRNTETSIRNDLHALEDAWREPPRLRQHHAAPDSDDTSGAADLAALTGDTADDDWNASSAITVHGDAIADDSTGTADPATHPDSPLPHDHART